MTVAVVFLGRNCQGGVSTALKASLDAVEQDLVATWQAQGSPGSFDDWVGLHEEHRAAHPGGKHTNGDALDIDYTENPYIATRSPRNNGGVTFGGEAPAPGGIMLARALATVVYDRALAFFDTQAAVAKVSARGNGEATADAYDRFASTSNALWGYLQLAFATPSLDASGIVTTVTRAPVPNPASADLATLLTQIPLSERLDEATSRANIDAVLTGGTFSTDHPDWPTDQDFWLRQILRDYEIVRVPMEFGSPSLTPAHTRNPAGGFLDLRQEVVVSLCDVGALRWGACDFGNAESGDVQHFDNGTAFGCETGVASEVRIDLQTDAGIQQALLSLGFDPGGVDNSAGGMTTATAATFMSTRGQAFSGLDDALRDELAAALRESAVPF
jgi:hypothetical protein